MTSSSLSPSPNPIQITFPQANRIDFNKFHIDWTHIELGNQRNGLKGYIISYNRINRVQHKRVTLRVQSGILQFHYFTKFQYRQLCLQSVCNWSSSVSSNNRIIGCGGVEVLNLWLHVIKYVVLASISQSFSVHYAKVHIHAARWSESRV